jgi:branched-chain amino acid transport system substrate-binding protein
VGVLFSRTGCLSLIEETQFRGTMVAIEEINESGGVNGREIEPVIYDPASENSLFRAYVHRLLVEDRIEAIFGCYASSSRKAVLPVIERFNGLLWYPTLYEGFEYSPNIIYTGASPNQNSLALFTYLTRHYGNRVYFIGSDYIYPRETNRIMRMLVAQSGGEVAGETYVPLNARREDFRVVMRDISDVKPDFIFSTVVGEATTFLYQSFADGGFDAETMPIASLTTTEAEISAMGADVAEGHFTSGAYFQGTGGSREEAFVSRYVRRFGESSGINMCAEAAYFQVHLLAKALALTNTLDTDVLRPVVLGSSVEAPQGRVTVSPASNHVSVWPRVGRANRSGRFDIVHQSSAEVDADPFLLRAFHAA